MMTKIKDLVTSRISFVALIVVVCAVHVQATETRYLTGNPADVRPRLRGPAHNLAGGGGDVAPALQWMIDQVRGCNDCDTKLDVVVLRSSGASGYNDFIYRMNGVDSVETLVITDRQDSNSAAVRETVRSAEIIFFAGGDQCNYVRYFKSTDVERAVERVYARGGGVGGTSAGLAIQSDFVFDACNDTIRSNEALANPYHRNATFTYNFFRWRHLRATITDTHFAARDRMGRLLAFIARQIKDGRSNRALGIAVDERTSLVVDKRGLARVIGDGATYFVLGDHRPEVCEPNTPLTFSQVKVWRVRRDETFDLRNMPRTGYYLVSVVNGQLSGNPY